MECPVPDSIVDSTSSSEPVGSKKTQILGLRSKKSANEKLERYRELLGITSTTFDASRIRPSPSIWGTRRPAKNVGYYQRTVDEEVHATLSYCTIAALYNLFLIEQIVVAAVITALGAFSKLHLVVSILGAFNTIIAAILAYAKSQGYPIRQLKYRNQIRRVREYAEFRERQFEVDPTCALDPDHEAVVVQTMYDAARQDQEDNEPATYVNNVEQLQLAHSRSGIYQSQLSHPRPNPEVPADHLGLAVANGTS